MLSLGSFIYHIVLRYSHNHNSGFFPRNEVFPTCPLLWESSVIQSKDTTVYSIEEEMRNRLVCMVGLEDGYEHDGEQISVSE